MTSEKPAASIGCRALPVVGFCRLAGFRLLRFLVVIFLAFHSFSIAQERLAVVSGTWSSPATWGGTLPGVEDDVSIPAGISVVLNQNVECGSITVAGRLEVERANRTLLCDSLVVQGSGAVFEVGTASNRFLQNFTLTLKGLAAESTPTMGAKALGSQNGGTLQIHGQNRVEWTFLGANAAVGATSVTLSEDIDWKVGETILITSSRLAWNEAETRTITAVNGRTVSFSPGLGYFHSGSMTTRARSRDGKSWTANLRAEVGLLSRNVKIQGDAASETSGFGGHIMVMPQNGTSGYAFIQGVELFRMGQKSLVGRYPMHWHMCAQYGAGQYFKDSTVHRSFNRAITIHGTESTVVDNNFCYDHLGHGIFLEDGSERFNVITRNVVLGTMRPLAGEEILQTDNAFNAIQNRSPASFWITNPNNIITDNIAAGTHGTGYWFAFPRKPLNASATHPRFSSMEPHKEPLGAFDRNVAHSCANGLDNNDQLDSADKLVTNGEWANDGPFYFNDCTWYSNNIAIYAGIGAMRKNIIYRNHVFSDNETNLFLATYQLCEDSLMIADSGFGILPSSRTRTVYAIYDGAGRMKNNHLVGYNASNSRMFQNIGAAIKHPNHIFQGMTYDPPVPVRSSLTNYHIIPPANIGANDPGHPRMWAQVILDVDGTIGGTTNSSIISNHPFLMTQGETRPSSWTNMYRSDRLFAQCRLSYGLSSDQNPNVSVVRTKPGIPTAGVYYIHGYKEHHQLPFVVREDYLYTCHYETLPSSRRVIMTMADASPGDHFLVCFKHFGKLPGIAVSGMTSHGSLNALKTAGSSGFYLEANGDFYVRPVATTAHQNFTLTWSSNITLPVVDSDGDGTSDGNEAAAGTDPFRAVNGTTPFVNSEFNIPGNFERWASFSGIANESVANGALSAMSSNTDPSTIESNLRVAGNATPYILVRMKAASAAAPQLYWERLDTSGYVSSRSVTGSYSGNNQWKVVIFPMFANAEWKDRIITSLRVDPVATQATNFQIDWIRSSNGDLDGDGLSDALEGDGDVDQDGLINMEDLDSDGDGIPDAIDPEPLLNSLDSDNDGIPDGSHPDDDNDGVLDVNDAFPFDPTEHTDSDGDGVGNNADAFPNDPAEQKDTDRDGIGNNADPDDDGDGISDVIELTSGRDPLNVFDFNYGFNTPNNFEGWSTSNVTSPVVTEGVLRGTTANSDPNVFRSGFSMHANSISSVVIKMKAAASGTVQFYWGTAAAPGYGGSRVLQTTYSPSDTWRAVLLSPGNHSTWIGQNITHLRIDPIAVSGKIFDIDWIRISNGDLDGDGLSDSVEGSEDLDQDGLLNIEDLDSDGDGIPDSSDPQPYLPAGLDFDNDGIPDSSDPDDDNDGVLDLDDAFPLNPNEHRDHDGDGIGDNADPDDDNDGTPDVGDAFPLDPNEQSDGDNDGIGDNADLDDDNDGFPDTVDAFPFDPNEHLDTDGDGIGNNADEDDDNDGTPDANDAFPLNPNESIDTDRDGIGNNADTDDDNDGVQDTSDAFPLNPNESIDTDGDGIGNNADTDDDNDGVPDHLDLFPLDPNEHSDIDGDGIGDNADLDNDNDGVPDAEDAFPFDPKESIDTDGDGIGNHADPDDDNDGVPDLEDALPLDPNEHSDIDGDGIGNNADPDDDNDGVPDTEDAFPYNPNESIDTDGDGIGNHADPDDDNDGVPDSLDAFPLNPLEHKDSDNDGIGDNADPDDDNDGTPDRSDAFPFDPTEQLDSDGDGVGNNKDAFPFDATEQIDTDGDGIGNNADTDDDGDGMTDVNETASGRDPLNVLDLNFGFNTPGNFEGWSTSSVSSPAVADGVLKGTTQSNKDPNVVRSGFSIRSNRISSVVVKMKANSGGTVQFYWGTQVATGYHNSRVLETSYGPSDTWSAVSFTPGNHSGWFGQIITQLRIDPLAQSNKQFEIDWIRASNGDLDGDGLSDSFEGNGDIDQDGLLNLEDLDSDGDGLPDATDSQPYLKNVDTDQDGIPDEIDTDDDNDGAPDTDDAFPLDANEHLDTDGDEIGNNADPDDDNDGVPDTNDAFPLDASEHLDTDGDGIGNNVDPDDDNDGIPDLIEISLGISSTEPIDPKIDSDGDGQTDLFEIHAGTNPFSRTDHFQWTIQPPTGLQPVTLSLPVKPGRTYRIHSCDNLATGEWKVIKTLSVEAEGVEIFTDPATRSSKFYRIEAQLDPP
jgi:hypothetical protein